MSGNDFRTIIRRTADGEETPSAQRGVQEILLGVYLRREGDWGMSKRSRSHLVQKIYKGKEKGKKQEKFRVPIPPYQEEDV